MTQCPQCILSHLDKLHMLNCDYAESQKMPVHG